MSITNLTIHKIYEDTNSKTLHITIEDGEYSSEIKYGKWIDEKSIQKKNESVKSSRLIVKIVTGNELNKLDLESCARAIDVTDKYYIRDSALQGSNIFFDMDYTITTDQTSPANISLNSSDQTLTSYEYKNNETDFTLNTLELSLEKVKDNNARIMENIHMLNRTLNYTKKKEILDLICPKPMRSYPCITCGKCFVYETGLKRHHSMRHGPTEVQPRWQIVWTCIQCFQVWPRQDQALEHSSTCCNSDSVECIREIKTSSLIQCEFCEKVFTSIPRVLRHLKTHTTMSNYQCNECEAVFSSYKTAEQHWLECAWQIEYTFSLPKMLLCNACDRKFKNYEQLYNHRYKVDHFMLKTHYTQASTNLIDLLVYQCESCGKCNTSVSQLKIHRNQFHAHDTVGMQKMTDNINYECYETTGKGYFGNQTGD